MLLILIFCVLIIVIIGIIFGTLKIKIKDIKLQYSLNVKKVEYDLIIEVIIFKYIKLLKININDRNKKINFKEIEKGLENENTYKFTDQIDLLKNLKIDYENVNLKINVRFFKYRYNNYIDYNISLINFLFYEKKY